MRERVGGVLTKGAVLHRIIVPAADGAKIAWLHAHGEVVSETDIESGVAAPMRQLEVLLTPKEWGRFESFESQT